MFSIQCYDQYDTSISGCAGDFEVSFQVSELFTWPGERKQSSLSPGRPLRTAPYRSLGGSKILSEARTMENELILM